MLVCIILCTKKERKNPFMHSVKSLPVLWLYLGRPFDIFADVVFAPILTQKFTQVGQDVFDATVFLHIYIYIKMDLPRYNRTGWLGIKHQVTYLHIWHLRLQTSSPVRHLAISCFQGWFDTEELPLPMVVYQHLQSINTFIDHYIENI